MRPENERLFREVIEANGRRLMAVARSYADGEELKDLYQEMLLQIWRSLDRFEGRAAVATWVYRIALNTALSYRRKGRRRVEETMEPPERATEGARDEMQVLREFMQELSPVDRAVLLLYLEDLSYLQMGGILGLSESNVGVRINRIKKLFVDRYVRR